MSPRTPPTDGIRQAPAPKSDPFYYDVFELFRADIRRQTYILIGAMGIFSAYIFALFYFLV